MRNMLSILQRMALRTIRITSAAQVHVAQRKTDKTQHCLSYLRHLNIFRHDDSSYSDEEIDEEKEKLGDDEDDEEKSSSSEDDNDVVPHDSSDKNSSTDRMGRFQRDIERTKADVEGRRREELNQCAQQGAEDPPNDTSLKANTPSSTRGFDSGSTVPRGMSNTVSIVKREKHVATRIMQFVKSEVFRRIKFVSSAEMFQKAFVKVIEFEKVPPHNRLLFQLTNESCFNKALNTKRSSCE
jgi:hypothetical protein